MHGSVSARTHNAIQDATVVGATSSVDNGPDSAGIAEPHPGQVDDHGQPASVFDSCRDRFSQRRRNSVVEAS